MTQYLTNRYIPSTITSKGQITLPVEVRKHLGVNVSDKVDFVITPKGDVLLTVPEYKTIADLKGAAGKLHQPLSWKEMKRIAHEDHADEVMKNA